MFQPENSRGIMCHDTEGWCRIYWLVAWKMTEGIWNFDANSRKSENLHFDGLLLSKAYKDLDEKVQKSYVSWQWRVM